ncbi:F0F1 ATP synthase subunit A [Planosporangium flavigriseum]|uniref:ATP synthase subunit a n=1 Tax=Planosporangium flavigriseum TaxID=373681 RepID=A0A8J3LJ90_9ACTN|nr:F0F1 ATP synthase subunit A [Planosporangium flavigriseum]NJC64258.1 F0F1 ATP synthase subunit A [Planosporangium flavigriseum]GIG74258.1 ATP synthase subunit a [Planosporangium flavigriseum]
MRQLPAVLAEGGAHFPPSVEEFFLPGLGGQPWISKITVLLWLGIALVILFFLIAYRSPKLVPSKGQWLAESMYGFIRDGVARDVIGHEGLRFAPYLTSLFLFIFVSNIWGIIPLAQISPMSHIAFPAFLGLLSWVLYNYAGIRKHGFAKYLRMNTLPPGTPWWVAPILVPIEFFSNLILRPITLAIRLFANMFAGHLILLVFTLGGFTLLGLNTVLLKPISLVAWLLAILLTLFEAVIAILQAYVFVLLTAAYLQGALAEEH